MPTTPDPLCPQCHGTGIASRSPYICGLTDPETGEKYDIYTMTACELCATEQSTTPRPETEGETGDAENT